MKTSELFSELWNDMFDDGVVYLSTYRLERALKYPGIGVRSFKDFELHKQWMREQSVLLIRKAHNDRVLAEAEAKSPKKPPPKGA